MWHTTRQYSMPNFQVLIICHSGKFSSASFCSAKRNYSLSDYYSEVQQVAWALVVINFYSVWVGLLDRLTMDIMFSEVVLRSRLTGGL